MDEWQADLMRSGARSRPGIGADAESFDPTGIGGVFLRSFHTFSADRVTYSGRSMIERVTNERVTIDGDDHES